MPLYGPTGFSAFILSVGPNMEWVIGQRTQINTDRWETLGRNAGNDEITQKQWKPKLERIYWVGQQGN